ncbi:HAD hydrolase-like protein [Candidatus Bipolaricaulota bacterium]|nr:HAD hydrolase-like protein [Candidatus Bipolaricaulota bacterium]
MRSFPGAAELVKGLHRAGVLFAVGTSAPRANLESILEGIGLAPYFASAVTAEDVTQGKPDPEVFLKAARDLGASLELMCGARGCGSRGGSCAPGWHAVCGRGHDPSPRAAAPGRSGSSRSVPGGARPAGTFPIEYSRDANTRFRRP